ncbi:hypothetical protein OAB79_01475 [Yoonia sp.]|nr:hypothetical protein [Yoonia sp.]
MPGKALDIKMKHFLLRKSNSRDSVKLIFLTFTALTLFINLYIQINSQEIILMYEVGNGIMDEEARNRISFRLMSLWVMLVAIWVCYILDRFYVLLTGSVVLWLCTRLVLDFYQRMTIDWSNYTQYEMLLFEFTFLQFYWLAILRLFLTLLSGLALYKVLFPYRN